MNISKVIAAQVRLGYLVQVGTDSYKVNKGEFSYEMKRRKLETKLGTVSVTEYEDRLGELGINVRR